MSTAEQQVDHLVRMANQIARNMNAWGEPDAVAARVAEHLTKFWTPAMREQLLRYREQDGEDLAPAVEGALRLVAPD